MRPPEAVEEAVSAFVSTDTFTLKPPTRNESSFIFQWGVRVECDVDGEPRLGWLCLAGQECRAKLKFRPLSSGRTSKATKHLKEAHGVTSNKTKRQQEREHSVDDECSRLRNSSLFKEDPARLRVLLETVNILNNNLPFSIGEHAERRLIEELSVVPEMRVSLYAKIVATCIVELYSAAKREIKRTFRENRVGPTANFSMVADFWASPTKGAKFLGVRVYFIDTDFRFRSILLGTRHFHPTCAARSEGIRLPFLKWIERVLSDFGLEKSDFFGATSDRVWPASSHVSRRQCEMSSALK